MKSDKKIFWHIGWPKTATTSLQHYCFPHLDDIFYAGKPWVSKKLERCMHEITYSSVSHFDERCLVFLREFIENVGEK